jgi:hypothetical protein
MSNPLLENFEFIQPWFSGFAFINLLASIACIGLVIHSALYRRARFARPSFIISILAIILYQIPLVLLSPIFINYLPNAVWFSVSINFAIIANLLWVLATPRLNIGSLAQGIKPLDSFRNDSKGFTLWFPIAFLLISLFLYFRKIPFDCTALYALFVDQDLTLLVREITGKLMGRTYAPHILNIVTGSIGPIVAFLAACRIYVSLKDKKWLEIPLWLCLLLIVTIVPLLGGAKGALVPMGVAMAITGSLVVREWKWRILVVGLIAATLMVMITAVKVAQESNVGKGDYQFGACIVKLGVCDRTEVLLQSLKLPKSYYGMSRERIDQIEKEMLHDCKLTPQEKPNITDLQQENAISGAIKDPEKTLLVHIKGLFYRIVANPLQMAAWHYLYVAEYGEPGFYGLSMAKLFVNNYVSIPAKVCEIYYSGDKTSACTAPTGYLFTYPAYLGVMGLFLALLVTIIFDVIGALVIKYSTGNFASLAIGLITVAGINFMVADFTTVIISHGAGSALVLLAILCLYRKGRTNPANRYNNPL